MITSAAAVVAAAVIRSSGGGGGRNSDGSGSGSNAMPNNPLDLWVARLWSHFPVLFVALGFAAFFGISICSCVYIWRDAQQQCAISPFLFEPAAPPLPPLPHVPFGPPRAITSIDCDWHVSIDQGGGSFEGGRWHWIRNAIV